MENIRINSQRTWKEKHSNANLPEEILIIVLFIRKLRIANTKNIVKNKQVYDLLIFSYIFQKILA